jgi:hypothetical protein
MNTKGISQAILAAGIIGTGIYLYFSMKKKDEENTNFDGNNASILAEKNYPYGQYFADRQSRRVSSRPFYRRNRGTYKA